MKVTTFAKFGVGVTLAATMSLGTMAAANAAGLTADQEDPTTNGYLVGVGSDTIQDVLYGISQDLGTTPDGSMPEMTSWTATGTGPLTYRSGFAPLARPNGSGAGFKSLEDSLGVTSANLAKPGDVDFARASGTQSTAGVTQPAPVNGYTTVAQAGVVTEIPFAIDSISFAVPAGSPFLLSNGGKGVTELDLAHIYDGTYGYIDTTDGSLHATAGATTVPINAFVPKQGSGSRQFFLKGLNAVDSGGIVLGSNKGDSLFANNGSPSFGTPAPYVGANDYAGNPVQEHDASVLTASPTGAAAIAPFSGAKYLGYHNGVVADPDAGKTAGTDYVLVPFDSSVGGAHAVLPYVDNSGTYAPNSAYIANAIEGSAKLTREVYNIIATDVVANPAASIKNRAIYDTFVGKGSKVCLDTATIAAYGFMKDANCGSTGFSADQQSTSTLTVTPPLATPVAGGSAVFTVAAQSTGNQGGTATVTINGTVHHVTLPPAVAPATQSIATINVPTPTAGTFNIGADTDGFIPTLQGVAAAQEAASQYTVAKATPVVKATAPKVSHTVAGKVTVTVTATGLHPAGTVTIVVKKGIATKATLSNKALVSGKYVGTLPKLAAGTYYVYVSYSGDANTSAKASSKLATLTVS